MTKAKVIIEAMKALSVAMTGKESRKGACSMRGGDATEFDDDLSRRECVVSGMCQKCQNKMFTPGEDDE